MGGRRGEVGWWGGGLEIAESRWVGHTEWEDEDRANRPTTHVRDVAWDSYIIRDIACH